LKITLGNSNPQINQELDFLDTLQNSEKIFYQLFLRKSSNFHLFTKKNFFSYSSESLRLFDLMIFKGNRFLNTNLQNVEKEVLTEGITFFGEKIFLCGNVNVGPYVRFTTSTSISPYPEKLVLKNLIFDYSTPVILQSPTIQNCKHQLDPNHCIACDFGFYLDIEFKKCEICPFSSHTFNKCNFISKIILPVNPNFMRSADFPFYEVDQYELSIKKDYNVRDFAYIEGTSSNYSEIQNSTIFSNLSNDRIYFLNLNLSFINFDENFVDLRYMIYNLFDSIKNDNQMMKFEIDFASLDIKDGFDTLTYVCGLTFYANSENKFQFLNYLFNTLKSAQMFMIGSHSNITFISLSKSELSAQLINAPLPHLGKVHPTSFPCHYFSVYTIYKDFKMFEYIAIQSNPVNLEEGYYLLIGDMLDFAKKCDSNCLICTNFFKCLSCASGYYLTDSKCVKCAPECISCVDHAQKCTQCVGGTQPSKLSVIKVVN
jgi:hypothetical protein